MGAGGALHELVIGDTVTEAADHGRDLRVEDRMRHEIAKVVDNLDILARCMKDLDHLTIGHQLEEWLEVEALRQRIDENLRRRARHLDQAELRPEGGLAQELGIDGDEVRLGELGAGVFEGSSRFDHQVRSQQWRDKRLSLPSPSNPICQYNPANQRRSSLSGGAASLLK